MTECFICEAAESKNASWYDTVLERNEHAVVLPALGSLAVGHVIVCPVEHVNAVQKMSDLKKEAFVDLLLSVRGRLAVRSNQNEVTVFEHSAPSDPDVPRSTCIDHAHINVLPGRFGVAVDDELTSDRHRTLSGHYLADQPPYDGYVMIAQPHDDVIVSPDIHQPQYFRRKIAESLNMPDEWDYALFPNLNSVQSTIELLR